MHSTGLDCNSKPMIKGEGTELTDKMEREYTKSNEKEIQQRLNAKKRRF